MPYADRDKQREVDRFNFTVKYLTDKKFKRNESKRKATWYELNREKVIARVLERRAELKKAA